MCIQLSGREITTYTVIYGVYIRFWPNLCIYGVFGREITTYTAIYGVSIRFWPTLFLIYVWSHMCPWCIKNWLLKICRLGDRILLAACIVLMCQRHMYALQIELRKLTCSG